MVAVQIRDVPEPVRRALAAEAERRGESLQTYLLSVLTREAEIDINRRLVVDWSRSRLIDVELTAVDTVAAERATRDRSIASSHSH